MEQIPALPGKRKEPLDAGWIGGRSKCVEQKVVECENKKERSDIRIEEKNTGADSRKENGIMDESMRYERESFFQNRVCYEIYVR